MKSPYKQICIKGKNCLEHRYIVEQYIGRKLLRNEYVHHINGNKIDNRIENLTIISPKKHNILHSQKQPTYKKCIVCGKDFIPPTKHRARNKICSKKCWNEYHKIISKKNSVEIDQYDITGKYIKTWSSIHEIGRYYRKDASNICACCKGKLKTVWHYVWKYHNKIM